MENINEIISAYFSKLTENISADLVFDWIKKIFASKNPAGIITESLTSFDFDLGRILVSFFESTLFKILFVIIALRIIFSYSFRRKQNTKKTDYNRQWNEISTMIESDDSYVRQLAFIKADQIMDDVLRELGYKGSTTQERIFSASKKHSILNDIISSHRVRNTIVHENSTEITKEDIKSHVHKYEKCLKYFKIIN